MRNYNSTWKSEITTSNGNEQRACEGKLAKHDDQKWSEKDDEQENHNGNQHNEQQEFLNNRQHNCEIFIRKALFYSLILMYMHMPRSKENSYLTQEIKRIGIKS